MIPSLKTSLLLLDDDPVVARVLQEQLTALGAACTVEPTVAGGLRYAAQRGWTAALVDEELEGQNCVVLAKELCEKCPGLLVVVLSQGRPTATLLDAVRGGLIFGTLSKPWLREDLVVLLHRLGTHLDLLAQIAVLKARPAAPAAPPPGPSTTSGAPIQPVPTGPGGNSTVPGTAAAGEGALAPGPAAELGGNDLSGLGPVIPVATGLMQMFLPNLGSSARRAVALSQTLVQVAAVTPEVAPALLHAAALHDLSLVKLERALVRRWLRDPSRCNPEELAQFKRHPAETADLVRAAPGLGKAADIIQHHHEHFDGSGYPDGLRGETIPWPARLLAAVVAFAYHHGSPSSALRSLEEQADRRFDPEAVRAVKTAVPLTTLPRGEREVLLTDLHAGMVLAGEILNAHRATLLPKGRTLSDKDVMRLLAIHRETPLNPVALVEE